MINPLKRADIMAIKDDLPLQFVPILLNMVVLHHDDHHIHLVEELVKIKNLVLYNLFLSEERIKGLQRTSEMAFLDVEHLECGAFTDVIYVLLIGQTIETNPAVIRDVMLFHNLMDALQNKDGLVIVSLHTLINHLG